MNKSQFPLQALLWFAMAWGLLLVLLSFVVPVVPVMSDHDGPQPRVSAFQAYGLVGILPATGILVTVVLTVSLLAFGRHPPSRTSLTLAEGVSGLVFVVGWLAPVAFHSAGLLLLPLGPALVTATLTSEVLRQSGRS